MARQHSGHRSERRAGATHLESGRCRTPVLDYLARGAPHGPDDGTIAPWAVVASLPFAPEIVLPANRYFVDRVKLEQADSFGLNQGPIVFMIENQRTGLIWRLMRQCPYIVKGLRRAGFKGGWL